MSLIDRLQHGWNAFMNKDPTMFRRILGSVSSVRPDRPIPSRGTERSIITSVYNRIALDAAAINLVHARLDENGRFLEEIDDNLNECLNLSANIDQTGKAFLQDAYMSMLDEGVVALVPIDTSIDPNVSNSFNIETIRVGKIVEWMPKHVKVSVYNEEIGRKQEIVVAKEYTAIIENPFFAIMNAPNSTLQRLIRKLNILDAIDDASGSGKLDMIIQLPYTIKSPMRRQQAEERRKDIEVQLAGSKYGIAYIDGTEKITQLNRPVENNLLTQIEFLTSMLYSQLGITKEIMDGSANEETMNNYYNRTIEPFPSAFADEMKRKFLTKTARSQRQSIVFFRDPFKLMSPSNLAELADKMTRNEIMTSNEVRQVMGMKPSSDPKADELRNSNISQSNEEIAATRDKADQENFEEGGND